MSLGDEPDPNGLDDSKRWLVDTEWSARTGGVTGFEQSARSIPDGDVAHRAQRRLHALGKYDHAARIGSALAPDAASRFLLARSFGRLGDVEAVFAALDAAVSQGFADAGEAVTSGDLAPAHGDPRWPRLLNRMSDVHASR
jgi:hypothetical protein